MLGQIINGLYVLKKIIIMMKMHKPNSVERFLGLGQCWVLLHIKITITTTLATFVRFAS